MVKLSTILGLAVATTGIVNAQNEDYRSESVTHRLVPPFLDRNYNNRFWNYGGNVLIKNNDFVRLTQDLPAQRGFLISKLGTLPESFQIEFSFKLHGEGSSIYGDGMAFWLLDEHPEYGDELGNAFGLKDPFKGSAIFFDTYKNNRPGKSFPYVVLMKGDGHTPYDQDHDGMANEIAGCSARGLHNPREISKARLTYVKGKFLSLELNYKSRDKWDRCFEVSNYQLDPHTYIAFSAQTGELSENHDIFDVHVYGLHREFNSYSELDYVMNGNTNADWRSPSEKKSSSGGGFFSFIFSWLWFFIKIGLFLGVVYVGWTFYRASQKKKRQDDFMYL